MRTGLKFGFCLILSLPLSAQAGFLQRLSACKRVLSSLVAPQPNAQSTLTQILKASQRRSGYLPLEYKYAKEMSSYRDLQKLAVLVPSLTPKERTHLIEIIQDQTPNARLREILLLLFHDRDTWLQLAREVQTASEHVYFIAEYLPVVSQYLPEKLSHELLEIITHSYRHLSKDEIDGWRVPKYAADLYFKYLFKSKAILDQALASGATAREAFRAYVNTAQRYFDPASLYTEMQTLSLLRELQLLMRESLQANPSASSTPDLLVMGSFAKGRADRAASDLDVRSNFSITKANAEDWRQRLKSHVLKYNPNSKFDLSLMDNATTDYFWKATTSLIFRITPESIEMLVFDPHDLRPRSRENLLGEISVTYKIE